MEDLSIEHLLLLLGYKEAKIFSLQQTVRELNEKIALLTKKEDA